MSGTTEFLEGGGPDKLYGDAGAYRLYGGDQDDYLDAGGMADGCGATMATTRSLAAVRRTDFSAAEAMTSLMAGGRPTFSG